MMKQLFLLLLLLLSGCLKESKRDIFIEAIENDNSGVISDMLDKGISADIKDESGIPVLCIAARDGHIEIMELLLKHGANVNIRYENNSPLMFAVINGSYDGLKLLLDHGADVNAKGANKNTPLIVQAISNPENVKLLLEYGADVDIKNKYGATALIKACKCRKSNIEIIKLIIKAGGTINIVDASGKTALDYVIEKKQTAITKLLKSHGAKTGAELKARAKKVDDLH
jgi:ankyrin repeat protein